MAMPSYSRVVERARSISCAGNLRQIGIAVSNYASDHDGLLPFINNPRSTYDGIELPEGVVPTTMMEAFEPYGLTQATLRCKADTARNNYFGKEGTSYEWRPLFDDEPQLSPTTYTRGGQLVVRNPRTVRLVMDTDSVHFNKQNYLYADGHVRTN